MRAVATEVETSKSGGVSTRGSRLGRIRKSKLRNLALESLETRQLLSTVPAPAQAQTPVSMFTSSTTGSVNSTAVAIDPAHPNIMVSVFEVNNPGGTPYTNSFGNDSVYVEARISTDGGKTWSAPGALNGSNLGDGSIDFTATSNAPDFAYVSNPSVTFDTHDNFYILDTPRKADFSAGSLRLNRFSVNSGTGAVTKTWGRTSCGSGTWGGRRRRTRSARATRRSSPS